MSVIDFHSHILPGVDHGCADINECVAQLDIMSSALTDIAVATPHFYPHIHKVNAFRKAVDSSVIELKAEKQNAPKICVGAEVLLCEGLESMNEFSELCISGTKCMLIELPTHALKNGHFDTIEYMVSNGYTVLLAHIDRYFKICPNDVDTLISMGALAQINADALFHHSSCKQIFKYLEQSECICALGSDLHGSNSASYKHFVRSSRVLKEYYQSIMNRAEALLLNAQVF